MNKPMSAEEYFANQIKIDGGCAIVFDPVRFAKLYSDYILSFYDVVEVDSCKGCRFFSYNYQNQLAICRFKSVKKIYFETIEEAVMVLFDKCPLTKPLIIKLKG